MSCELSPSASAFGSMLLAFIGSIINGISSGGLIAFFTGCISWFSVIRILAAGVLELHLTWKAGWDFRRVEPLSKRTPRSNQGLDTDGTIYTHDLGPGTATEYCSPGGPHVEQQQYGLNGSTPHQYARPQSSTRKSPFRNVERNVNLVGWPCWAWSAIYMPISETIWLCVNLRSPPSAGLQHLVRALAMGLAALGLTFDFKQRYAAALGARWGPWAFVTFNVWNAAACMLLGVETLVLFIYGAMNMSRIPIPLLVVHPLLSIAWAVGSWMCLPPIDGERPWPMNKHGKLWSVVAGALMGALAGLSVAAPAFALWQNLEAADRLSIAWGQVQPGMFELGEYLACEDVSAWAKFAAVMP